MAPGIEVRAKGRGGGRGALEPDLASQDVEVVGRRGAVDNLPVDLLGGSPQVPPREPLALVYRGGAVRVLISHLQKPLHTAAAVLWPLQLVAPKSGVEGDRNPDQCHEEDTQDMFLQDKTVGTLWLPKA